MLRALAVADLKRKGKRLKTSGWARNRNVGITSVLRRWMDRCLHPGAGTNLRTLTKVVGSFTLLAEPRCLHQTLGFNRKDAFAAFALDRDAPGFEKKRRRKRCHPVEHDVIDLAA